MLRGTGDEKENANKYIWKKIELNKYEEAYEFLICINLEIESIDNNIWIKIGNYKFDKDEYEEALIMYENIMNIMNIMNTEMNDILYINIAYCYQQLNESAKALKYYYKYLHLKDNENDIYCIHNIAVLEYYNKNYIDALKMYNKMNKQHIEKNKLYFNIAVCYHNVENYEKALNYFAKNLQFTNKNRDNCLISIAWIYSKKFKNYRKALETYRKIKANIINNHSLEFDIAWTYQQSGKYKQALKYYYKYLHNGNNGNKHNHNNLNNLNTLHNIAWIYINYHVEQQQKQKAKEILIKILDIDKNHFYANYTYGIYLRDNENENGHNYRLSLSCLQIAHQIQANNTQIMIDIAKTYKYMNEFDCAKSYYLKAIHTNSNDFYSNLEFAHFLAIIGDNELSDVYYRKVLNIYTSNNNYNANNLLVLNNINMVENYTNYGHVLHKLNKNIEAISVVKRAYLLSPNDCNTLNNLGYYNYVIGNYDESEKYLKLCLSIDPKHEYTNSTYGNLLYDKQEYDDASIYFEKALALKSDINHKDIAPKILYNYSMILYHHKKKYLKSLKYCKQSLKCHNHTLYEHKTYYLMANIYIDIDDNNYAKKYINKAFELKPQNNEYKALYNKLN